MRSLRNAIALAAVAAILLAGCGRNRAGTPVIEFTTLPPAGEGSPDQLGAIEGRVRGALPGDRIVLFALSGVWWVQPLQEEPFTEIDSNSRWKSSTHPGSSYAALLVTEDYRPPLTMPSLPQKGGAVIAVASVEGATLKRPEMPTLQFSGYQWAIRNTSSDHGGTRNNYDPANSWTDEKGFLHLRISKRNGQWMSSEVNLLRNLGYGSYRVVVQDVTHLEPAAVFSILTWDDGGPPREMDIEISRWGEAASKNAQYVMQPYYVPANIVRFTTPPGTLTYSMRWAPGRVYFNTTRGSSSVSGAPVSEHVFTSGVPSPGTESIHLNLYIFDNKHNPLQNESEVVIEKFEYLP